MAYDPINDPFAANLPPPANMNPGVDQYDPGMGGDGGGWGQMSYYDKNFGYGGGGKTQGVIGALVGGASNLFIPGLGFITSPMARMLVRQFQRSGGGHMGGGRGQRIFEALNKRRGGQMSRYNPNDPYGMGGQGKRWRTGEFGRPENAETGEIDFGNNASNFGANTQTNVGGIGGQGGSFFGGSGSLNTPGGVNLGNLGGGGAVNLSALGGGPSASGYFGPNAWKEGRNAQETLANAMSSEAFLRGNTGMTQYSPMTRKWFKMMHGGGRGGNGNVRSRHVPMVQNK